MSETKVIDNRRLKSIQFELWHECNNRCEYCYLREPFNRHTDDAIKIENLENCLKILNDESRMDGFELIGFIGGEFFQGQLKNPKVYEKFMQVMDKTAELYNSGKIKSIWLTATLTIGKSETLFEVLRKFNDLTNFWVTTSWDTIGRFHNPKMLETWESNVKRLHEEFPDLKLNVCTILTGDLIDRYLKGEFRFHELAKKWQCAFFYKQCGVFGTPISNDEDSLDVEMAGKKRSNEILPNFFPKRQEFIKFLLKFKAQEPEHFWDRLFNIKYRADELIRHFNDGKEVLTERFKNDRKEVSDSASTSCGHPITYRAYIDSDECCLCDKEKIGMFED